MTTTPAKAAPEPANLDPNVPPLPQSFLRNCEEVAAEEAAKFFTAFKVGATVQALGANDSVAHVVVRAYEPHFAGRDLESSKDFTVNDTLQDMRNAWQVELAQLIAGLFGLVRVATEEPSEAPPSDVEPQEELTS